jgi:hypothetical protein
MAEDPVKRLTAAQAIEKAQECRDMAKRVANPAHRTALEDMAKAWEQMARTLPNGNGHRVESR